MGNTRQVVVGGVRIGGGAPIAIQSMSTFSPLDTDAAASQIQALHQAGAQDGNQNECLRPAAHPLSLGVRPKILLPFYPARRPG